MDRNGEARCRFWQRKNLAAPRKLTRLFPGDLAQHLIVEVRVCGYLEALLAGEKNFVRGVDLRLHLLELLGAILADFARGEGDKAILLNRQWFVPQPQVALRGWCHFRDQHARRNEKVTGYG